MQVDPSVSLREVRAEYRAACEASNEIIGALGDAAAKVPGQGQVIDTCRPWACRDSVDVRRIVFG